MSTYKSPELYTSHASTTNELEEVQGLSFMFLWFIFYLKYS